MGLDIFIHKVKNVRNSKNEPLKSIKEYAEINKQRAKDKIKTFADTCIKDLESLKDNAESYKVAYDKIFNVKIKDYTKCYWIVEKMQERVHSIQEVKEFFDDFIDFYYPEEDAYFRKVNFMSVTTSVVIGSVLYKACVAVAVHFLRNANDLKLITSVLFLIILVVSMDKKRKVASEDA